MNNRGIRALIAVLLLPALAAAISLWSMSDRAHTFDKVPAAVVNLDEGTMMEVDGTMQKVPLGRILAGALTDPETVKGDKPKRSLNWKLTDRQDGIDGIKQGKYEAVIEIPRDFSKKLATAGKPDAQKAVIYVRSNQATNYIMGILSEEIADAAASSMGHYMTKEMLSQIFLGMGDIKDGIAKGADGADRLATGSEDLHQGTSQLVSGVSQLQGGAGKSVSGARALAGAMNMLNGGAQQLSDGTGALSGGSQQLSSGAGQLVLGLIQLDQGLSGTPKQAGLLPGLEQLNQAVNVGVNGQPSMKDAAKQLAQGSTELAAGVQTLAGGATQLKPKLVPQPAPTPLDLSQMIAGLQQIGNACPTAAVPPYCNQITPQLTVITQKLTDLQTRVNQSSATTYAKMQQLYGALLGDGTNPGLLDGIIQLQDGANNLKTGMGQLSQGIDSPDPAHPGLAQALPPMVAGAQQMHNGLVGVKNPDGTWQQVGLINGARQLQSGSQQLHSGIMQLDDGAHQLQSGTARAQNGATTLANGLRVLDAGVGSLYGGAVQLDDGTGSLSQGATKLADGLNTTVDKVPDYSASERENMATVGAQPVRVISAIENEGANDATSSFPLSAALMLWLGAFSIYLIMPSLRKSLLDSPASSFMVALRSWLPAAGIGLFHAFAVTIVGFLFNLQASKIFEAFFFMVFVSLVFVTVIQMFMAVFGQRLGSVVTLLFFILQGASLSGILPIETAPAFFAGMNNALPLSLANNGLMQFILGGHASDIAVVVAGLLAWFIVSAIICIASVSRKRQLRFKRSLSDSVHIPSLIS